MARITREQAESVINRYPGNQIYCYDGNHNPTYVNQLNGINIYVDLENNEFELKCRVDQIFILESGRMGPLVWEVHGHKQFNRMYQRFLASVRKLSE